MKSIIYLFIAIFISGILISGYVGSKSNQQQQVIEIQCLVDNPDSKLIDESCSIIKNRLEDNEVQNFDMSVNWNHGIIKITFNDKIDLKEVLPLIVSVGNVEFYETYNRADVVKQLDKSDKLFILLDIASQNSESENPSIIGTCKPALTAQVDACINQRYIGKPDREINFVWGKALNSQGDYCLYLLKPNPVLDNQQIVEVSIRNVNQSNELMITFNKEGALVWQDLSKNNINKSIAIVVDMRVYSAPMLQSEIKNGKCSISGNFTTKELTQLKSLINNGKLTLGFELVTQPGN